MARKRFTPEVIRSFLVREKIATLPALKQVLGTTATMTVLRQLEALDYLSSYSHRGEYYTLREIPDFDEQGLWSVCSVRFSRRGTLVETARALVEEADAGLTAAELRELVGVECKGALLNLSRDGRVERERLSGRYVYLSGEPGRRETQRILREKEEEAGRVGSVSGETGVVSLSPELKAALLLFYSLLDEKQRRLYAGLEAHKLGRGGDGQIAGLLELDVHTVAKGRKELLSGQFERERVRREGGGRGSVEKKRPRS